MPPVAAVSRFLGVLAIAAVVGSLVVLVLRTRPTVDAVRTHATTLAAAVAVTATGGSLWYSEVANFVPCELCWFQRVAMYPLAVLLPLAAVRRDTGFHAHARVLAGLGLATSLWHVALQRVPALAGASTCDASASCNVIWVEAFGLLTIPTMAACGFLAIVVLTSLRPSAR